MRNWLLFILLLPTVVLADVKWDWSESVEYQENHDPSMIWLTDGRKIRVEYSKIPWEAVEKWPRGKAVVLGYQPEVGVVLFDPESQKSIPILSGLQKHPIDLITEKCLEDNQSTQGMVECYDGGYGLWDKELNRSYSGLMASLNDEQRKAVQEAQRQWLKFRDAQIIAIGAISNRDGTIGRIVSAEHVMNLIKEQAQRLNRFKAW
jgi:uncharacterized protein YecT (DUF1311 family)